MEEAPVEPGVMQLTMRFSFISEALTADAHQEGELKLNQNVIINEIMDFDNDEGLITFKINVEEAPVN